MFSKDLVRVSVAFEKASYTARHSFYVCTDKHISILCLDSCSSPHIRFNKSEQTKPVQLSVFLLSMFFQHCRRTANHYLIVTWMKPRISALSNVLDIMFPHFVGNQMSFSDLRKYVL